MFARGGPGGVTEKHWRCCTAVFCTGTGEVKREYVECAGAGGWEVRAKGAHTDPKREGKGVCWVWRLGGGVGRGRYGVGGSGRY